MQISGSQRPRQGRQLTENGFEGIWEWQKILYQDFDGDYMILLSDLSKLFNYTLKIDVFYYMQTASNKDN